MKKLLSVGFVMVTAFFLICVPGLTSGRAQGSVSLQVFYDELQPYGTWMQNNQYGYVWMPRVDRSFTPYATNGYWINTEYGNTWVSDYSWGWAPFHYGRWFYDDFYGWMWVPDTMWAPAWVAWRSGGGYYGWAPMMPGYGYSASYNYYNRIPHHYWSFVPYRYITYRSVYNHCVPRPQVVNIINHTTIVTNNYTDNRRRTTYFTGPSRREIEGTTHQRVDVYSVSDRNRPGRTEVERGRVSLYKPDVNNSKDPRTQSMPSRFMRDDGRGKLEQVEASRERSYQSRDQKRTENDLPQSVDRSVERNESGIEKMDRIQQMERQRNDDAFQRFERERENPVRESERNMNEDVRKQQLNGNEDKVQEQRNTERQRNEDVMERFERQRENPVRENQDVRKEQLNRNEDILQEQRNTERQRNEDVMERFERQRENPARENQDVHRQQLNRNQDMLQEQRNIQRQRENAVRDEQQRNNNESIRRQQSERQNPQRQFSQPDNDVRRSPQREPQNFQRMERQTQPRSPQPNTTFERQRSSTPREQQIQRSAPVQRSSPDRSNGGSRESAPRRRN